MGVRRSLAAYVRTEVEASIHEMITGRRIDHLGWRRPGGVCRLARGLDFDLDRADVGMRLTILRSVLPEPMWRALALRLGLDGEEAVTRHEAAEIMGVTYGQLVGIDREARLAMARPIRSMENPFRT
jgi:hypothetical protein